MTSWGHKMLLASLEKTAKTRSETTSSAGTRNLSVYDVDPDDPFGLEDDKNSCAGDDQSKNDDQDEDFFSDQSDEDCDYVPNSYSGSVSDSDMESVKSLCVSFLVPLPAALKPEGALTKKTEITSRVTAVESERAKDLNTITNASIITTASSADVEHSTKNQKERVKRPCIYCGQYQSQLLRHLKRKHKDEEAVQAAMRLPKQDQQDAFAKIRKLECFARFGSSCQYQCPSNCKDSVVNERVCDSVNGTCSQGCKDGYLGLLCDETCPIGTYGPGCLLDCSDYCVKNDENTLICHHENGQCLHGCIQGYGGEHCTTFIKDDNSGLKIGIGIACGLLVIAIIVIIIGVVWMRKLKNLIKEKNQQTNARDQKEDIKQEDNIDINEDADGYIQPRNHEQVQVFLATNENSTRNVTYNETENNETNHYEYIQSQPQTGPVSRETDNRNLPKRKGTDLKSGYENQMSESENLRQNVLYENEMTLM